MTKDYRIADFRIRIAGSDLLPAAGPFQRALDRFEVAAGEGDEPLFTLHTDRRVDAADHALEIDRFDFPEVGACCRFARSAAGWHFTMQRNGAPDARFFLDATGTEAACDLFLRPTDRDTASLFRFGLWILFGLAVNPRHAIPIHSSTIVSEGGAVLFLGESGTGKSTHTKLWLEHVPGSRLLNDDSPVIRMKEGAATVYGSPWSGKTPCYRNESFPIRAFVRLSQAPHNAIRQLPVIHAIGALLPSCPPSFAFDATLQDHICATLSELIARVPVYHMECLPDRAAALLSRSTIFGR